MEYDKRPEWIGTFESRHTWLNRAIARVNGNMSSYQSMENALYMSYFLATKSVPVVAAGVSVVFAVSPWYHERSQHLSRLCSF